ncbi:DUF3450 family protein [Ferrimonas pelagia]|uniref:DUF3450 domain-containing protein n=1 Tax=Ferrimonas pelagia TaxID=1177826 RepID=A0ABP9EDB9_9GAMM
MLHMILLTAHLAVTPAETVQHYQAPLAAPLSDAIALGEKALAWQQQANQELGTQQSAMAELAWLEFQIAQTERYINQQQVQIAQLQQDLDNINAVRSELAPNLEIWYADLERWVLNDRPFERESRLRRLTLLRQAMDDVNIGTAERLRQLFEALLIEVDMGYGNHISDSAITVEAQTLQVRILRLGRVAQFYQTYDGQHIGWFEPGSQQWQALPKPQHDAIRQAFAIASQRQNATLVPLPLGYTL